MSLTTFPQVLEDQLRRNGSRPLVTFYDDATGERVELSAVTFANWVAKTAGVLQDELDIERGATVLVDLPTHWLTPVWLGACWATGAAVTDDVTADSALIVCGPDGLERYAGGDRPVVALSLLPMGRRFTEQLPAGVVDFGTIVWGQPDAFVPYDAPDGADVAWAGAGAAPRIQAELLAHAAQHAWAEPGTRLLTDRSPCSEDGLLAFLAPLMAGGGTVWVANPDPECWPRRGEIEQATAVSRTDPAQPA